MPVRDYFRPNCPASASAPGLDIPTQFSFDAYSKQTCDGADDELALYSSNHPRINYTAREHHDGGAASRLKHYVGIFDEQRGTVQLLEARKMDIKSTLRREDEEMRNHTSYQPPNV